MINIFAGAKRLVILFVAGLALTAHAEPSTFDFQSMPLGQVVSLYYKEVSTQPYIVCDEVLQDVRLLSVRAAGKTLDSAMVAGVLDAYGYEARPVGGVVNVCKKRPDAVPEPGDAFIYRPLYRDVSYLVDLLNPLIKGVFANKRVSQPAFSVGGDKSVSVGNAPSSGVNQPSSVVNSPASAPSFKSSTGDDYLLFLGSDKEKARLVKLLAQVDTPSGEVVIKGYIYEVGKNASQASALDLFMSVLNSKISVTLGAGTGIANSLRIKTSSIDLVASALNTDGRFKVVTSPYTRVRSGSTARFVVGAEVPILGSILTNPNGQAQQSVEYRSAGTIFEVSPKVRDKSTDVDLFQQISSFVSTETGVNGSPTLNKRELRTSLTVDDGEIMVIAGLNDSKDEETKSGLWFLPFATSQSSGKRNSELLILLEIKKL